MNAFGATVPRSFGWVDIWWNRDLSAENSEGGVGGITAPTVVVAGAPLVTAADVTVSDVEIPETR
jgi:hypothetical protein